MRYNRGFVSRLDVELLNEDFDHLPEPPTCPHCGSRRYTYREWGATLTSPPEVEEECRDCGYPIGHEEEDQFSE